MGCASKIFLFSSILTAVFIGYVYHSITQVSEIPKLELDQWWGPGEPKPIDTSIRPFKIEFKAEMIADLKYRLNNTYLTPPLEGVGFEYGFNNDYLKELIHFWGNEYNFKEKEKFFNKFPHFKTNIQGLDIHYIHVKPKVPKEVEVLPLLLVCGFPGSFREFYEIIPLLTTPQQGRNFVFEVIVPSTPGLGFSQAPSRVGFGADKLVIILRNLLKRLGHEKYYIAGGNWAGIMNTLIANFFPNEVLGLHTNTANIRTDLANIKWFLGSFFPSLVVDAEHKDWMYPISETIEYLVEEMGYCHIQASKPDTIGVALKNSPAGIAAYILEKFSTWTNRNFKKHQDGGFHKKFQTADLLDLVMVYWVSDSISTSFRLYAETVNKRFEDLKADNVPVFMPVSIANFRYELAYQSEFILREKYRNIVHVTHYEDGGSFPAFEVPEVLAKDIWSGIAKMREVGTKEL